MKINTLLVLLFCSAILASCEKGPAVAPAVVKPTPAEEYVPTSANAITVPEGFDWSTSRNVNFYINISTEKFPGMIHMIHIYEGDPADGKLLGKGSVTDQAAFKCTVFLPNQVKNVTIVCTAPDNTKTLQKWAITDNNIVNTKLAAQ